MQIAGDTKAKWDEWSLEASEIYVRTYGFSAEMARSITDQRLKDAFARGSAPKDAVRDELIKLSLEE